jgi:hypothetical protein
MDSYWWWPLPSTTFEVIVQGWGDYPSKVARTDSGRTKNAVTIAAGVLIRPPQVGWREIWAVVNGEGLNASDYLRSLLRQMAGTSPHLAQAIRLGATLGSMSTFRSRAAKGPARHIRVDTFSFVVRSATAYVGPRPRLSCGFAEHDRALRKPVCLSPGSSDDWHA